MIIESISFNSKSSNKSEILITWDSGDVTNLFFNSSYPLQVKKHYENAIYGLMEQKQDILSFDELFGLFSWWFVRNNLMGPIVVATFRNDERIRIGAKIKSIREEKNMEAKQLSMITGIDAANISRIERGKSSAGIDTLSKIANALGYRIDLVKINNLNNK